jgi:hypothetical protein
MGACCSKFGTYFVKKEEGKTGNGSTPKLNKLEHKTSFIAEKVNTHTKKFNAAFYCKDLILQKII